MTTTPEDDVDATTAAVSVQDILLQSKTDYLVGLSPEYWSHVPMTVMDVLNLKLKDGINYMVPSPSSLSVETTCHQKTDHHDDGDHDQYNHQQQDLASISMMMWTRPVSKCQLVGCIVYADHRKDGSMAYVLDDGTGLIDCIHWSPRRGGLDDNDNNDDDYDIFHLPSLLSYNYSNNNYKKEWGGINHSRKRPKTRFELGDRVRVFGKIDCLALTEQGGVVREVHASLMELAEDTFAEAHHWRLCVKDRRHHHYHHHGPDNNINNNDDDFNNNDNDDNNYHHGKDIDPQQQEEQPPPPPPPPQQQPLLTGLGSILHALGPDLRCQIRRKVNLPSADDTVGYWRVFGPSCKCKLPYMDQLLYCHCQATFEANDPNYTFRDAVLSTLLDWQQKLNDPSLEKLVFAYRDVKNDETLRAVAAQQQQHVTNRSTNTTTGSHNEDTAINQLFVDTFSALRRDGIVALLDSTTDEYMLITRANVLEPYILSLESDDSKRKKNFINFEGGIKPRYLAKVNNERLFLVKRLLVRESTERQSDKSRASSEPRNGSSTASFTVTDNTQSKA